MKTTTKLAKTYAKLTTKSLEKGAEADVQRFFLKGLFLKNS